MGYCEHKISLYTQGIKPPPNDATIAGNVLHQKQEQYEKEHLEKKTITREELANIKKDIEFPYEAIETRLTMTLTLKNKVNLFIYGRADKIYRSQETLTVEETKYPKDTSLYLNTLEPYQDQKLQALIYLNSEFSYPNSVNGKNWFLIPHKKKAYIINIKDRQTRQVIKTFHGIQTLDIEKYMRYNLERFALIATGEIEPSHHQSKVKCLKCGIQNCQNNLC